MELFNIADLVAKELKTRDGKWITDEIDGMPFVITTVLSRMEGRRPKDALLGPNLQLLREYTSLVCIGIDYLHDHYHARAATKFSLLIGMDIGEYVRFLCENRIAVLQDWNYLIDFISRRMHQNVQVPFE